MTALDNDAPAVDEPWCMEQRARVAKYLERQAVMHGRIGEWPAWHVAPYVSIWAIESAKSPGWVGWWAVCGDLPTDYISAKAIKHPRAAMRAFAERWIEVSAYMIRGESHPTIRIGAQAGQAELGALLASRAQTLMQWSDDDTCWGPDYD